MVGEEEDDWIVFSRPCMWRRLLSRLIASWFWFADMGGEGGGASLWLSMGNKQRTAPALPTLSDVGLPYLRSGCGPFIHVLR